MKKFFDFIKSVRFLSGLLIGLLTVRIFSVSADILKYDSYKIEYLKILFSWPVIVLIITLTFFSKFYSAIDYFIRNLKVTYKNIEATSQQVKDISSKNEENDEEMVKLSKQDAQEIAEGIQSLQNERDNSQNIVQSLQQLVQTLATRSEFFEFMYLDKILVFNTKIALRDLRNFGSITKEMFISQINIPQEIPNISLEKIAIFNALLINGLINENGSLVNVSEKGERFLNFEKLV